MDFFLLFTNGGVKEQTFFDKCLKTYMYLKWTKRDIDSPKQFKTVHITRSAH